MSNSKTKYILGLCLILFFAFTFSNCKKYPENPHIYLSRASQRILGVWEPFSFLVNGEDSISVLKSKIWYGAYWLKPGDKNGNIPLSGLWPLDSIKYYMKGDWNLQNHKKQLRINFGGNSFSNYSYGPYAHKQNVTWNIEKLTSNELWITVDFNAKNYYAKFQKVE